jgi:hypothetical protein
MLDQRSKLIAVSVIFLLEKLSAKELRDDLSFSNAT